MAQARRAELVLSDKRAAADELRTDCASYADALAALQRALGAERAAHGASVRRQQAELGREGVGARVAARGGGRRPAPRRRGRQASKRARRVGRRDGGMAEWRTLVQAEGESNHATVRGPAGDTSTASGGDAA